MKINFKKLPVFSIIFKTEYFGTFLILCKKTITPKCLLFNIYTNFV